MKNEKMGSIYRKFGNLSNIATYAGERGYRESLLETQEIKGEWQYYDGFRSRTCACWASLR